MLNLIRLWSSHSKLLHTLSLCAACALTSTHLTSMETKHLESTVLGMDTHYLASTVSTVMGMDRYMYTRAALKALASPTQVPCRPWQAPLIQAAHRSQLVITAAMDLGNAQAQPHSSRSFRRMPVKQLLLCSVSQS